MLEDTEPFDGCRTFRYFKPRFATKYGRDQSGMGYVGQRDCITRMHTPIYIGRDNELRLLEQVSRVYAAFVFKKVPHCHQCGVY